MYISLRITKGKTVERLKRSLEAQEGYRAEDYRLVAAGRQLEDERKLDEYNVQDGSTIFLLWRNRRLMYMRNSAATEAS